MTLPAANAFAVQECHFCESACGCAFSQRLSRLNYELLHEIQVGRDLPACFHFCPPIYLHAELANMQFASTLRLQLRWSTCCFTCCWFVACAHSSPHTPGALRSVLLLGDAHVNALTLHRQSTVCCATQLFVTAWSGKEPAQAPISSTAQAASARGGTAVQFVGLQAAESNAPSR